MSRYLIDANLPYRFSLWHSSAYRHVFDLDDAWSDAQLWDYVQREELILITKDADFSERILLSSPPPKVIHVRLGNLTLHDLHLALSAVWREAEEMVRT